MIKIVQGELHNLLSNGTQYWKYSINKNRSIFPSSSSERNSYTKTKNQILEDLNTSTHIMNQIKISSYYKKPTSLFARNYETTHAEISSTYYKEKL